MDAAAPHLARLGATSRPAGSGATDDARQYCAEVLQGLGFAVREHPFEYSKFPGAYATPVAGVLVVGFATALVFARPLSLAVALVLLVAAVVIGAGLAYAGGRGVLDLPFLRRRGVNLEALRGSAEPKVWLVAHIDSKWQPVSMIMRVVGVMASAVGLAGLVISSLFRLGAADSVSFSLLGLTCVGAVPLMLSYVGFRNHGTLDNASGVATVLEAAQLLGAKPNIGVLITDAEELALAGARAWARGGNPAMALNCDSIDDEGTLVVMFSAPRPERLVAALERAARVRAEPLRVIRLIPGILTDHVALAAAGWETLTLSRGTVRTLRRIHTSDDTLATMRGTGITGAARVLADAALELC